jgi:hypothetical protein
MILTLSAVASGACSVINDILLMTLATVDRLLTAALKLYANDNGDLVVVESGREVAFPIARVFAVRAGEGAVRGEHVHKRCSQFLIAVNGAVDVLCDDGAAKRTFRLDRVDAGLLLPPGIWATQTFRAPQSVVLVLCDQPYDESDYIRAYQAFLAWRRARGEPA